MSAQQLQKVNILPEADQYDFWRRRMAGEVVPIHDGEPQAGFYRLKTKNGEWQPVAYWFGKNGDLRCRVGNYDINEQTAKERWLYASKAPITHEVYKAVIEGGGWPDVNEVVAASNNAPPDDSIEAVQERIDDLVREAERLMAAGGATTQAAADQASDVANSLGEFQNKVIALHKAEKQPHLDAGRAVDGKWFGLRDRAADIKTKLKALVVTPWLRKQDDEKRAAQVAAIQTGTPVESLPETRTTAGSSKRSSGLRTYYRAEIIDKAALMESLKDNPDLLALLQKIADGAASKKVTLPGCKIIEDRRAA